MFKGYLICSDVDGTFRNHNDITPNMEAVKFFTDNGGKFTFATGRTAEHLKTTGYESIINAPACVCNGGIVYDYETDKVIYEKRLDFTVGEFIDVINTLTDKIIRFDINISHMGDPPTFKSIFDVNDDMKNIKPIKLLCVFGDSKYADELKAKCINHSFFKNTYIGKSWAVGLEFNSTKGTKGEAAKYIKEYLSGIHTLIGVGDFENDIPLLKLADIGVSVENAIDEVKKNSQLTVKACNESGIADLINILYKKEKGEQYET